MSSSSSGNSRPNRNRPLALRFFIALGVTLGAALGALLWANTVAAQTTPAAPQAYLPVIATNRAAPGTPGQTSSDLIDKALRRGEIDAEMALIYKVYASFGDPRLPAAYQGQGDEMDTILMRQVAGQYDSLSSAAQTTLAPFFQPPVYLDSWYAGGSNQMTAANPQAITVEECAFDPGPSPIQPGGWGCIDGGIGVNIRVWWQLDHAKDYARAQQIIQVMQSDIWPKLTILMRREPPSDKGPHRFTGRDGSEIIWGDGGGGRLDIYLVTPPPNTGGAATLAYPPGCDLRPSFILIDPNIDEEMFIPALTHEFFHTFQFAADQKKQCAEWEWWSEATANWAIDFVYPDDNWEHQWAYRYLQQNGTHTLPVNDPYGGRNVYLLPLFLTHHFNDPGIIRRTWENAATSPNDSLAAIDQVIGGQLTNLWHELAKVLPGEAPYDSLRTWDNIEIPAEGDYIDFDKAYFQIVGKRPDGADIQKIFDAVQLEGGPDLRYDMPTDIEPLALRTYRFRFTDDSARSVAFTNPLLYFPQQPDSKILALYKVEGDDWTQEDWTDKLSKTFCRAIDDERLEELIVTISNGQWRNRSEMLKLSPDPLLAVTNIGCARWEGTFETTIHHQIGTTDILDTYSGRFVFEPISILPDNPINQYYELVEASVEWNQSGTMAGCQVSGGPTTYSTADQFSGNLQTASFSVDKSGDYRIHTGVVSLEADGVSQMTCPDGTFTSDVYHGVIATLGQGTKPITADGLTLQGRHTEEGGGVTNTTTWKFTHQP